MFSKEAVDSVVGQLKREWGSDPNWERLLLDVYVGMARADAGVALGSLDARALGIIQQHLAQAKA